MDKLNTHYRSKSGQILVVLIILLGLIGGGVWWLYSSRDAMAKEGREFGREAIQRIVVQRDATFFASRLSPAARGVSPSPRTLQPAQIEPVDSAEGSAMSGKRAAAIVVVLVIIGAAVFAPFLAPHDPNFQFRGEGLTPAGLAVDGNAAIAKSTEYVCQKRGITRVGPTRLDFMRSICFPPLSFCLPDAVDELPEFTVALVLRRFACLNQSIVKFPIAFPGCVLH